MLEENRLLKESSQSTVNDLIIGYSNRINNEYIKNESETITGVDIKFEIDNIDSDKVFIKNFMSHKNIFTYR